MYITKVELLNIMGFKNLQFEAGTFNEITGQNDKFKTTVLKALKGFFKSGNDVTLIRNGSDEGSVCLEFSDGTTGVKTFSPEGAELVIKDSSGTKIKKPAGFLDKLTDLISINPVSFLLADKKERANILLESMPLKITKEDLKDIDSKYYSDINIQFLHALETIATIRKPVYDDRTGENRLVKDKDSVIKEMQEGLNGFDLNPEIDYAAEVEKLENVKSQAEMKLNEYLYNFDVEKNKSLDSIRESWNHESQLAESEYQHELDKIKAIRDQKLKNAHDNHTSEKEKIIEETNKNKDAKKAAFEEKIKPVNEAILSSKEKFKQFSGFQKQTELLEKFTAEREIARVKVESLTNQINVLDNLKISLLNGLPISGLEIIDGMIYRNGVLFDSLNMAQQVEIAIDIAKLRAGELKIMCVDGMELFDPENYEIFKEKSVESGMQMFCTRVGNSPALLINGQKIN